MRTWFSSSPSLPLEAQSINIKFISMPKLKTRKSITKRFKITKTGKVQRRRTQLDHYRAKKSGKKIRKLRKWINVSKPESKKIKKLLT